MNYDIIGDIHGDCDRLQALLKKLGYRNTQGAWRHPGRQALFVGDFIDRGPRQLATCNLVRRMVDAGSAQAVMGNHEFNAIAWFHEDPKSSGHYLRPHTDRNRQQHQDFLAEVEGTDKHQELVDWFLALPLWLDLDELRVIHACWHPGYLAYIESHLDTGLTMNKTMMALASDPDNMAYQTVEGLLKGLEISLPDGALFHDKCNHPRTKVRVRWWDTTATTFRQSALLDEASCAQLPGDEVPCACRIGYTDTKPVFFGHYSLPSTPAVLAPNVACVDFYNKKDNPLVAYRWSGEPVLQDAHFVAV